MLIHFNFPLFQLTKSNKKLTILTPQNLLPASPVQFKSEVSDNRASSSRNGCQFKFRNQPTTIHDLTVLCGIDFWRNHFLRSFDACFAGPTLISAFPNFASIFKNAEGKNYILFKACSKFVNSESCQKVDKWLLRVRKWEHSGSGLEISTFDVVGWKFECYLFFFSDDDAIWRPIETWQLYDLLHWAGKSPREMRDEAGCAGCSITSLKKSRTRQLRSSSWSHHFLPPKPHVSAITV